MAPPANTTAATAIDLGVTLPVTVTQRVDDSGTTYDVWYSWTATFTGTWGVWAYGDASVYKPATAVNLGPTGAPVQYLQFSGSSSFFNRPIQVPVISGTTYYLNLISNSGNPSPANLTITAEQFAQAVAPVGSIGVNDERPGYPVAFLSATTGQPIRFEQGFAAGDGGEVLPSGISLFAGYTSGTTPSGGISVYSPILGLVAQPTLSGMTLANPITQTPVSSDQAATFYVADASSMKVTTVNTSGVQGGTVWTLASSPLRGIAPARDNTILYYAGTTNTVRRWDLINNIALSDLVSAVTGETLLNQGSLLVLADGTVLAGFNANDGSTHTIRHYSAAGALLDSYTFTGTTNTTINRLTYGADDPVSFWVWLFIKVGGKTYTSRFQNILVSGGTVLSTRDGTQFDDGISQVDPPTLSSPVRYGHSDSCPFWIVNTAVGPIPPPVGTARVFRRVRRFPIAFENNLWIFLSRLEVLCQQGIGTTTGQGSAPLVMFRLSTDGGSTFGNEIQMSLGALGQYDFRTYVNRLGRGRNLVGEISCSDPIAWAILDAFCDYSVGPS